MGAGIKKIASLIRRCLDFSTASEAGVGSARANVLPLVFYGHARDLKEIEHAIREDEQPNICAEKSAAAST